MTWETACRVEREDREKKREKKREEERTTILTQEEERKKQWVNRHERWEKEKKEQNKELQEERKELFQRREDLEQQWQGKEASFRLEMKQERKEMEQEKKDNDTLMTSRQLSMTAQNEVVLKELHFQLNERSEKQKREIARHEQSSKMAMKVQEKEHTRLYNHQLVELKELKSAVARREEAVRYSQ